ncbi:hypothetical protein J4218_02185 [Candidatus Pacearchaeota archaeon]|nr:hypothetical protein [uncultured archaeon]MBS3078907.1 hypothetical protein [Candidatus Pacearchaeota archaeon]
MSEATLLPIVEVKNPVVIVNGAMNPKHAILADLREEQSRDVHFFEKIDAYLGTVDRKVGVGYYGNQAGSSQPYTHSPLEPSQILSFCPEFEIENYHTSFLDLLTLITASPLEQQMYNALRPAPSVRNNLTWCNSGALKLDIKIQSGGHSIFEYSALGLKLLEVNSHVNSFGRKMDIFQPFISVDDTGCYQEATAKVLEQRVQKALVDAEKIDDFNFIYRFKQYEGSRPYHKNLEAARNVARRMRPQGKVPEREIEQVYDSTWNAILQQKLPDMVRQMQYGLSALLQNGRERSVPFGDTYSQTLDIIVDRLLNGVVSLDQVSMQTLGSVIVLNNQYEQTQNQGRVDSILGEISSNQSEIKDLARRSGELLEEMQIVQQEVITASRKIEDGMRKRLGQVFNDGAQIEYLVRDTKPLSIEEEPVDEIPF